MASLVPGYEYDIFISYRQKDNKHDGWVTEFVNQLKGELESTFKEDISVYFDINPHDGLLETHDVDASLKDKLKCLVFIPIISRTYCDPNSFAWEHEFRAFIEQASKDQFGLKVKLAHGNVALRVLPIQIHDLYPEDKGNIEKELGGVLRSIEFIYKEPGVNRPLTPGDDKEINLNKTKYRNQINKVAIAIEEIIHGLSSIHPSDDKSIQFDQIATSVKEGKTIKQLSRDIKSSHNTKRWIISGLFFFLCLALAFGILKFIEKSKQANEIDNLERSIAVLPFINDSPDKENEYFCNGMMDEILHNLQKIKDFRVLSRTSVEQYRGTSKPTIPKIAKALNVNFIVEGSVQKYGNTLRLRVQLIAADNEKHLWGKSFEQEIKETKDIFKIQSLVAQTIATELKATITPEEKQIIEKTSTNSLKAYDFYQRGNEEFSIYLKNTQDKKALLSAENYFLKALEYDPEYAIAYTSLAYVYLRKHFWEEYFSEHFMDSVLILADKALSLDGQLSEAYLLRGGFYMLKGNNDRAIAEYNEAIKFNPNSWEANKFLGWLYTDYSFVKALECLHKAISLNQGKDLPSLLRGLGSMYGWFAGFKEKEDHYQLEAFNLDFDTSAYFNGLAESERALRNYGKSIALLGKCYATDTNNIETLVWLAYDYYMLNNSKESLIYVKKFEKRLKELSFAYYSSMKRIGYVYWQCGYKREAEYWFNEQERISKESLRMGRIYSIDANYDLAAVYAFKGNKKKAYENLMEVAKIKICPLWLLSTLKDEPLFNSIRNEPKFQKIVKDMESNYQAEHERVRKWLEKR